MTEGPEQSWRPIAIAGGLFGTLLLVALVSSLLRDPQDVSTVVSTPPQTGDPQITVDLGCDVRGRTLDMSVDFETTGGALTGYEYSFGDGTKPSVVAIGDERPNPTAVYRYKDPGRYVVTLTLRTEQHSAQDTCVLEVR